MTFSLVVGVVNIKWFESAFLVFSGLGFIPSLIGTFSQTIEAITAVIEYNYEKLAKVGHFIEGFIMQSLACVGIQIQPNVAMGSGAMAMVSHSRYVIRENLDTGRIEDAMAEDTQSEKARLFRQRMRAVFDEMDTDSDGILQHSELFKMSRRQIRKAFLNNDVLMSNSMFNKFFSALDQDKGIISFYKFVQAVRQSDPHYHVDHDGDDGDNNFGIMWHEATPTSPFATPSSQFVYSQQYMPSGSLSPSGSHTAANYVGSTRESFDIQKTVTSHQGKNSRKWQQAAMRQEGIVQSVGAPMARVGTTNFLQKLSKSFRQSMSTEPDQHSVTSPEAHAQLVYMAARQDTSPIRTPPIRDTHLQAMAFYQHEQPDSELGKGTWC